MKSEYETPHGRIDLSSCMTVKSAEQKTSKRNALEVSTHDTTYFMYANTEKVLPEHAQQCLPQTLDKEPFQQQQQELLSEEIGPKRRCLHIQIQTVVNVAGVLEQVPVRWFCPLQ